MERDPHFACCPLPICFHDVFVEKMKKKSRKYTCMYSDTMLGNDFEPFSFVVSTVGGKGHANFFFATKFALVVLSSNLFYCDSE